MKTAKGYIEPGVEQASDYQAWIDANVPREAKGKCREMAESMARRFPELGVYGVYDMDGSGHAWCLTPDGKVVDPTGHQFGGGTYDYSGAEPASNLPIGRCMNCGELCYGTEERQDREFCSPECRTDYGQYVMRGE